ncbi:hypothetical protein BDP27DRAFT_719772 [Rhodocollybia butyracea]|uniref:Uncharacterized protein n=1 Tax=Rhodocollybia butyracea TaxID=206335 RepID=A0A9P5PUQ4_9AGAR|nr:hypothetical protein BDP27DRAFT_719772 [Rhodocollybia butyracea]
MNDFWCSYVGGLVTLLAENSDKPLVASDLFRHKELPYDYMEPWPPTILLLLGDLIVTWRAWALLPHDKYWRWFLSIMMFVNIAINIIDGIFNNLKFPITSESESLADIQTFALPVGVTPVLDCVSIVLSFAVNMTAMILIIWKAWYYHRLFAEASIKKQTQTEK